MSFIDVNPLCAFVAEKQQSNKKLCKSENKQSLIMRTEISEKQCHRPQGILQFSPEFFQHLTSKTLMSNYDCIYIILVFHFVAFHFLTLFCFGNSRSNTHVQ